MNNQALIQYIDNYWDNAIIPTLKDFIGIPNKSPLFAADWEQLGHMEQAVSLLSNWCLAQNLSGLRLEVIRLPGRTPLIFIEIQGQSLETILLYGHLDKQPEMEGWQEGLEPWQAVQREERLYGRGGADDGYAVFAAITAIKALQQQRVAHSRCIIIIEACEESGSYDLPFYITALREQIGEISLVICLDSGCENYDQLWITTSLRGLITGNLTVSLLTEGIHSGTGSGIVASSFRVIRQLLDRIEDPKTGVIKLEALQTAVPSSSYEQLEATAKLISPHLNGAFPFQPGTQPVSNNTTELLLNQTWRSALTITGIAGMPSLENAGNVMRPFTTVKLSLRLPPLCDAEYAQTSLKTVLEYNPPYQAKVSFTVEQAATGWSAPTLSLWLKQTIDEASELYFGKPAAYRGEGGTIPFMKILGDLYPEAQFIVTGVLGPQSNAHGPNEFLHIPTGKKLTCCVAYIIAKHQALLPL